MSTQLEPSRFEIKRGELGHPSWIPPAGVIRLLIVVLGGLVILQSTQDLGLTKLAYLGVAAVAFIGSVRAMARLNDRPMMDAARPWLIASVLLVVLIALSLPVALANGTPLTAWLRDAATYGLFASAPVFALDAASSMRRTLLLQLTVVICILGALSYGLNWVALRNLAVLPIDQLVLPTASLPTTLFVVSLAGAVVDRRHRFAWILLGGGALGVFLVAGTRSALFLLVALPVVVIIAGRPRMRSLVACVGVGLVALTFVAAVQSAFISASREIEPPIDVAVDGRTPGSPGSPGPTPSLAPRPAPNPNANLFQRLEAFLVSPDRDGSVRERVAQYQATWRLFESSPLIGVGLGHQITWTRLDGAIASDFTADTPLVLPAKTGIAGLAWLAVLAVVWIGFVRRLRRAAGVTIPGLALASWAAILIALVWAVFSIEDKGFSFALMLLLSLGFQELEQAESSTP